jgi:hypothetical protein
MKTQKNDQSEPYFYVALVLRGSEKQYLNLVEYLNQNNSQVIYQRKSLTYLRIVSDDGKFDADVKELSAEVVV